MFKGFLISKRQSCKIGCPPRMAGTLVEQRDQLTNLGARPFLPFFVPSKREAQSYTSSPSPRLPAAYACLLSQQKPVWVRLCCSIFIVTLLRSMTLQASLVVSNFQL